MKNNLLRKFETLFGAPDVYVNAPGRANIIGEHTDYNHGLVLPFAIEHSVEMVMAKNDLGRLRIMALDISEKAEINVEHLIYQNEGWTRYFVNSLVALDYNKGIGVDVIFGGNLPQGGGVSSSSALTCGFLAGINQLFEYNHDIDILIDLASQAENGIGLNGGTMDQTSILKGRKNNALLIDFLDNSMKEIPLPDDLYSFYLFNSGQKHNLVETEYNKRRATCEAALRAIKKKDPSVYTLRDVTSDHIEEYLDDKISKNRCRHVLSENSRVLEAVKVLESGYMDDLGHLLLSSHASLSMLYAVSTPEIDYLVDRSQKVSNILGSRIMGGGFGGCTINLVIGNLSSNDISELTNDYKDKTGLSLTSIQIKASNGVHVEKV